MTVIIEGGIDIGPGIALGGGTPGPGPSSGGYIDIFGDSFTTDLTISAQNSLVYDSSNNSLNIRYIASLSLANNRWLRFGNSRYNELNSTVNSLDYSNITNDLFVFGNFTTVTNINPLNTYTIEKFATYYF